jgi:hypothetical protein
MNLKPALFAAVLLLLLPTATIHAQDDGGVFNHQPPAAWPDWFTAPGAFGVTTWIHSDEKNLMGGAKPDHWTYRAKSKLKPEALVALVKNFADNHHFATIEVIDPHQKIVATELSEDDPASMQKALSQHHNYIVAIEATDDDFVLSLNQGAP